MREAVFAHLGIAITSEWNFAPELASGIVKAALNDWELPSLGAVGSLSNRADGERKSEGVRLICRNLYSDEAERAAGEASERVKQNAQADPFLVGISTSPLSRLMRRETAATFVPVIELSYADDGRRATKRSRDFPIMNKTPERKTTVLITGALTGIGRATAFAFARQGARLIVSGRRDEAGHALVKELRELGTEAEYVRADVRYEKDVENLVDQAVRASAASISL